MPRELVRPLFVVVIVGGGRSNRRSLCPFLSLSYNMSALVLSAPAPACAPAIVAVRSARPAAVAPARALVSARRCVRLAAKKSVGDLGEAELKGKVVFERADLNVPLDKELNITDDTRIRAAIPTLEYLTSKGAKVMLTSHLVRSLARLAFPALGLVLSVFPHRAAPRAGRRTSTAWRRCSSACSSCSRCRCCTWRTASARRCRQQ